MSLPLLIWMSQKCTYKAPALKSNENCKWYCEWNAFERYVVHTVWREHCIYALLYVWHKSRTTTNQHHQQTNGPDQVHSIALPYKIWISVYGFTMVIAYLSIIKRFNRMCCVHLHALLSFFFRFVHSRKFKLQIIKCLIVNERHFNSSNVANIIFVEYCRFPFILAKWKTKKVNCICLHCNYR